MKKSFKKFSGQSPSFYIILIVGLLCMGLNIFLELGVLNPELKADAEWVYWLLNVISRISSTIGLALLVGNITSIIKKSEDVKKLLDNNERKEVIMSLLSRENNLDNYKEHIVDDLINISSRYRTNSIINMYAYIDKQIHKVKVDIVSSYIEYGLKSNDEIFSQFDNPDEFAEYFVISDTKDSNNYVKITKENMSKSSNAAHRGGFAYKYSAKIPRKFSKNKSLKIEKKSCSVGSDHWVSTGMMFSHPTKGVTLTLTLSDGLIIKNDTVIGKHNLFSKTSSPTEYRLSTDEWVSHLDGVIFVIAKSDSTES